MAATDEMGRDGAALGAGLLGFALSGFFDGIVLHQILQWHHLLSALDGDLRWQVAADGWFHAGMYAVAALGLWRLARSRAGLSASGAGRALVAWALVGFGLWHVVDAVGSHWLLGIHRIRMDAASPLAWDLGWLALFGVAPLALGLRLRGGGSGPGGTIAAALVASTIAAGLLAARAPDGTDAGVIAFAPWVDRVDALRLASAAGERIVWTDGRGVFVVAELRDAAGLYAGGAIFVGGRAMPAGCLDWRA